jgi:uncharacterized membrane protein
MTQNMNNVSKFETPAEPALEFSGPDMGALAHLYRAEVYRSTMWRTRLDNTTNWAVASLGLAISVSYHAPDASPLPLLLVGLLICVFLMLEARRYRFFNVWRTRARWMEYHFYGPMLLGKDVRPNTPWAVSLWTDYTTPFHRISLADAIHRRLKRNYIWIFVLQGTAYFGKLAMQPTVAHSFGDLVQRAAIGPVSGLVVLALGVAFNGGIILFALFWPIFEHFVQGNSGDDMKSLVDTLPSDLA